MAVLVVYDISDDKTRTKIAPQTRNDGVYKDTEKRMGKPLRIHRRSTKSLP